MRLPKACSQCRSGKRRCDRESNSACIQCVQRNLQCSATLHNQEHSYQVVQPTTLLQRCRFDAEILHLVDLYFRFYNDKPHSLFHEHTFRTSVVAGTVSQQVLLAMMSLSARFSESLDIRVKGPVYATKAKVLLHQNLENASLDNIRTLILLGNVFYGDSRPDVESLYFVLSSRMAQLLRLGIPDESDDGVTRETKLRVWWSCFVIDTWASIGSNVSRQFKLPEKRPRSRLPMEEATFYKLRPGDLDVSDSQWKIGFWGHMVRLMEIYTQIQDFHKYLVDAENWDEDSIEHIVLKIESELTEFDQSLGPNTRFSSENLENHLEKGLGGLFIAFHLGYHHYWTLLFYLYLDHRRPPTKNGKEYARRCKIHATTVCDILEASRKHSNAGALYNIVGHVAIVSSSVLVHTYLFGEPEELPDARRRLESNFESLLLLRKYWNSVDIMINRLVTFQNNCLRSLNCNTHRFDKWMVKFLLQHALELEEKDISIDCDDTESDAVHQSVSERGRVTNGIIRQHGHFLR